jgi:hypothetical protein
MYRDRAAYTLTLWESGCPVDWIAKDLSTTAEEVSRAIEWQVACRDDRLAAEAAAWTPEDVFEETEALRGVWI